VQLLKQSLALLAELKETDTFKGAATKTKPAFAG
jgi:hypothetical protein